ncbi:MAG: tetratricopeptide repeat protein [Candidatus Eisenbacteria bacterium]|nr:tetratricopeptide repeat protein [Candidatus Eisenbacteria bacterium]
MNETAHATRAEKVLPWAIAAVALAARLAHLAALRELPLFEHPYEGLDADLYTRLGRAIAGGNPSPPGLLHAAPLYAYWLGALFRLGAGALLVRLLQAALGAGAALLLYRVGRRVSGTAAGAVAGFAAALYSPFLLYEGTLQSAALVPFLGALLLSACLRARRGGTGAAPAAGLLFGAAALNRPDLLPLLAALPVWLLFGRTGRRGAALFLAGALALLLPWSITASRLAGGPTPVSAHGGIHFFIGNHEGADGALSPAAGIRPTPEGFDKDARRIAEREAGRRLSSAEVSRFWLRRGLDRIRRDPGGWILLLGRKTLLFGNDYEIPNNEDLYFLRRFSPALRWPTPLFGIAAPLALFGLFFGRLREGSRSLISLFLGAALLAALLFFVTGRYRLPAVPALLVAAGAGAAALAADVRAKRPRALLLLPLIALSNWPLPRMDAAAAECRLASSFIHQGDYAAAERAYERTLALRPGFAEARRGLARIYRETGKTEEAMRIYLSLGEDPREERTARNDLAVTLAEKGRTEEALSLLEALLIEDPSDATILANLGAVRMRRGEDSLAAEALTRALSVDDAEPEALFNMGILEAKRGRPERAAALLERHLAAAPDSKRGLYNAGAARAMAGDYDRALRHWERLERIDPDYPGLAGQLERVRALTGGRRP